MTIAGYGVTPRRSSARGGHAFEHQRDHGDALLSTLLLVALFGCATDPVEVAAANNSTSAFTDLEFASITWGDLAPGETTDFTEVDVAYDYTYVHFSIGETEFLVQPRDYVGEDPLPPGRYVYELTVADPTSGSVDVELQEISDE